MKNVRLMEFKTNGDNTGTLIALEQGQEIPFDIKRVYYIFDTKHKISRGFHAHKELEQMIICVNGSCTITVDNGSNREEIILDYPNQGIHISNNIWREMHHFSQGCVLLVLTDKHYCEDDYIRNYDDFLRLVNKEKCK